MGEEEGSLEDAGTPLSSVANAFEDLAATIASNSSKADCDLSLSQFTHACSLVSVLFGSLGFAFKFAEMEYVAKVRDLSEASKTYSTLNDILDYDVNRNTVRQPGSLSRNLRRVRQGLDLIRALCEQFLSSEKAVGAGMYALPTREQLLLRLNETGLRLVAASLQVGMISNASLRVSGLVSGPI
ncbi:ACD11 homolog protein isoform X4 [Magnolia sinica]|uniref:ACD11 homolog protein isoform X4 n=1 Tax=Magnolia sinica TaxID=86752 RepID=UPI0026582AF1|nr:ACD11 homolog protein isoform X4 [Magnolia sinica]